MNAIATNTFLVKLKKPTKRKHNAWIKEQKEYAACLNYCLEKLQKKTSLSSKNLDFDLKSAIKNEAVRRAKKAISDVQKGLAERIPVFHSSAPISINNQNWCTECKNGKWYIGFTTNEGKVYLPVVESDAVHTYFPFFQVVHYKKGNNVNRDIQREFRGTIQLLRKGRDWYLAIPVQVTCEIKKYSIVPQTMIGVDLGLRHIATVSEPLSGKRQLFSGKQVGYVRRRFRSLRSRLGKKKALRALKRLGQKEHRWMEDYNRKLAKDIVSFAMLFERPVIKLERLDDIRSACRKTKRADRTIHSWAFYQLKQFIKERAAKHNISVADIHPYKTSQTCFECKHAEKSNRSRDRFRCQQCGHQNHADLNASKNIAASTSLAA